MKRMRNMLGFGTSESTTSAHNAAASSSSTRLIQQRLANVTAAPTLQSLPIEIFDLILANCAPDELLKIARTCKHYREIILHPSRRWIWQHVMLMSRDMPKCPAGEDGMSISEPAWVHFLYFEECTLCGEEDFTGHVWGTRKRYCEKHFKQRFTEYTNLPFSLDEREIQWTAEFDTILLPVVNISPEDYHIHLRSYKYWAARVAAALSRGPEARRQVLQEYKAQQEEAEILSARYMDWSSALTRRHGRMRRRNGARNMTFILDQLRAAGHDVDAARKNFWVRPPNAGARVIHPFPDLGNRRNTIRFAPQTGSDSDPSSEDEVPPQQPKGRGKKKAKPKKKAPAKAKATPGEREFDALMEKHFLIEFGGEEMHWPPLMTEYIWSQPGVAERASQLYQKVLKRNSMSKRIYNGGNLVPVATERLENAVDLLEEMYDAVRVAFLPEPSPTDEFPTTPFLMPITALITLAPVSAILTAVFHASGNEDVDIPRERNALATSLTAAGIFEPETYLQLSEHYRRSKQADLSALIGTSLPPFSLDRTKSTVPPSELAIAIYRCAGQVGPNNDDRLPPEEKRHGCEPMIRSDSPCKYTLLSATSALAHPHGSSYVSMEPPPFESPWHTVNLEMREAFLGDHDADVIVKIMLRVMRAEPWNSGMRSKKRPIVFYPQASVVASAVVRACGKDPKVTTTVEMDAQNAMFVCQAEGCHKAKYRQYMRWRTAVTHWMEEHFLGDQTDEAPQFVRVPERDMLRLSQREQPKPTEFHRAIFVCINKTCKAPVKMFPSEETGLAHLASPTYMSAFSAHFESNKGNVHEETDVANLPPIDVPFDADEPAPVWDDLDQYTQLVARRAAKKARHYLASIGHTELLTRVPSTIPARDAILRSSSLPRPKFVPHPDFAWKQGKRGPRKGVGAKAKGWPKVAEDMDKVVERLKDFKPVYSGWYTDFSDGLGRRNVLNMRNRHERPKYEGPKRVFEVDSESEGEE